MSTKKTAKLKKEVKVNKSRRQARQVNKPVKNEPFTHIDRSNGQLLKRSQLNPEKPWISPLSNQASVEELTQDEKDNLPAVNQ
jgi:hypothetical protein